MFDIESESTNVCEFVVVVVAVVTVFLRLLLVVPVVLLLADEADGVLRCLELLAVTGFDTVSVVKGLLLLATRDLCNSLFSVKLKFFVGSAENICSNLVGNELEVKMFKFVTLLDRVG